MQDIQVDELLVIVCGMNDRIHSPEKKMQHMSCWRTTNAFNYLHSEFQQFKPARSTSNTVNVFSPTQAFHVCIGKSSVFLLQAFLNWDQSIPLTNTQEIQHGLTHIAKKWCYFNSFIYKYFSFLLKMKNVCAHLVLEKYV